MEAGEKQAKKSLGYVVLKTEDATVDKYDVHVEEGCATISIKFIRSNKEKQEQKERANNDD